MARQNALEDFKAPAKLKLSALWASTMFCYVYGDYFGLFMPGSLLKMNDGIMGPLGKATPEVLIGVSVMMAIPSLMVGLSLLLPPAACRWLNVILGVAYTAIMLLTMPGSPPFYIFFGVIEVALTLSIVWVALAWRRETAPAREAFQ